jgi:hypothetical protein
LGFIAILEIFSGSIVIGGCGDKIGGEWEPCNQKERVHCSSRNLTPDVGSVIHLLSNRQHYSSLVLIAPDYRTVPT